MDESTKALLAKEATKVRDRLRAKKRAMIRARMRRPKEGKLKVTYGVSLEPAPAYLTSAPPLTSKSARKSDT